MGSSTTFAEARISVVIPPAGTDVQPGDSGLDPTQQPLSTDEIGVAVAEERLEPSFVVFRPRRFRDGIRLGGQL